MPGPFSVNLIDAIVKSFTAAHFSGQ